MSIPAWIPIAISAVGTSISLLAFAYQVHRARFNQSVDLLFRLENDFFGGDKIAQRALAAQDYATNPDYFAEMEDILDFFETVAMLTRKGALDLYMVWHTFGYWIERYYAIAKPHIAVRQRQEPGVWEDLDWLMPRLMKLQAKKGSSNLNDAELARFLQEESQES
jgi:hypothetical protein